MVHYLFSYFIFLIIKITVKKQLKKEFKNNILEPEKLKVFVTSWNVGGITPLEFK